jgi:RNA polymerase sigma-70 factor (ECF subfamily)
MEQRWRAARRRCVGRAAQCGGRLVSLDLIPLAKAKRVLSGEASEPPPRPIRPGVQLDLLFRSQGPRLLRFLTRRAIGRADADDLVQECFLRLARRISGDAFPHNPEAYLHTIAVNLLRDRARTKASRGDQLHEPLDEETIADTSADQEQRLALREKLDQYDAVLARLRPKTREIFLLHRIEGLTYGQIAAKTGLSQSGVEKHMMKAIAHLDRLFEPTA